MNCQFHGPKLKTRFSFTRLSALLGLLGPAWFACALAVLTLLKYDFLRTLGWDPLTAPTFDWPSGLALGAYGWLMTATFLFSGLCLFLFALGLRRRSGPFNMGTLLLAAAGLALAGLAFTTDPTLRSTPATLHGRLHDLSFVILGLSLMPGMLFMGAAFHSAPDWADLSTYTFVTAALALPAFFLKGAFFYGFLFAILLWSELIAWRLWKLAGRGQK
jgi:hypothetical protein